MNMDLNMLQSLNYQTISHVILGFLIHSLLCLTNNDWTLNLPYKCLAGAV